MSRIVFVVVSLWAAASAVAQSDTAEIRGVGTPSIGEPKESPFEKAKSVKTNLDIWSVRMHKSLEDIERVKAKLDLREIDAQKTVLDRFRTILKDVRDEAAAILAAHDKFVTDFHLYRDAVKQAPSAFDAVAREFEKKAHEETDDFLKQQYADFATSAKALAKRYTGRLKELDQQATEIGKMVTFVQHSIRFVDEVQQLLAVIPATNEGAEVEKYVKRLNAYIRGFEETFKILRGVVDKIGEPQSGPSPGEQERKAPRQVTEAPAQPLSFADYRSQLAALRQ